MTNFPKCAYCREQIVSDPIEYAGKLYCCEACAFEASQRINSMCGSRRSLETAMHYARRASKRSKRG
jgi:hypothetical protein